MKNAASETENPLFAENLRKAITRREKELGRKLPQKEIGENIGVTPQSVSYYVLGQRVPNATVLYKLAVFLNCFGDYLIGLTDDQSLHSSAVDELGLSPDAVNILRKWNEENTGNATRKLSIVNGFVRLIFYESAGNQTEDA